MKKNGGLVPEPLGWSQGPGPWTPSTAGEASGLLCGEQGRKPVSHWPWIIPSQVLECKADGTQSCLRALVHERDL